MLCVHMVVLLVWIKGNKDQSINQYPPCSSNQALTTPLARLPGIARNDRRATVIVGRSCPPNLFFENSGNKRFPTSNSCTAQLMCSWFWEVFCEVTAMLDQLLFTISMISSSLFSILLYDQLGIRSCRGYDKAWINERGSTGLLLSHDLNRFMILIMCNNKR